MLNVLNLVGLVNFFLRVTRAVVAPLRSLRLKDLSDIATAMDRRDPYHQTHDLFVLPHGILNKNTDKNRTLTQENKKLTCHPYCYYCIYYKYLILQKQLQGTNQKYKIKSRTFFIKTEFRF